MSFCCAGAYRITCLHPVRNCVLCTTMETVCSIACAAYVLVNKKARRYCTTSIMHTVLDECSLIKPRNACMIHAEINPRAWITNTYRPKGKACRTVVKVCSTFICMLNMACSMFTNHNAYTTYKAYESFSNSSVSNASMENPLPYPTQSSIIQTACSLPSQQGTLHKPQCRYTYTLPSQSLSAATGGSVLGNHISSVFDPELEARAKQLQELERYVSSSLICWTI